MAPLSYFFFFNDTATTEIYTLSLHDALPISVRACATFGRCTELDESRAGGRGSASGRRNRHAKERSEEHTSELQSQSNLVCRLLLEKKKNDAKSAIIRKHLRHWFVQSAAGRI